jgi:hypothetical protein
LVGLEPPEAARRLREAGAFNSQGMLDSAKAAQALALDYKGKSDSFADDCDYAICETHYFAPKNPQHFFIKYKSGQIIDPLGLNINYPIVSYRLFKTNEEEEVNQEEIKKQLHEWHAQLVRTLRQDELGHLDNDGAEADIKLLDDKFLSGDYYEAGNLTHRIYTSDEAQAYRLSQCPAKNCSVEVNAAIAKTRKEDQEIMDEKMKGLIDPKDCPAIPVEKPTTENAGKKSFWQSLKDFFKSMG